MNTFNWEAIGQLGDTYRLWIPGGWLIRIDALKAYDCKTGCDPAACHSTEWVNTAEHIIKVDDPEHLWDGLQKVENITR